MPKFTDKIVNLCKETDTFVWLIFYRFYVRKLVFCMTNDILCKEMWEFNWLMNYYYYF